jgi:pimeloyl-ACP methyl ester carboxylesterase
MLPYELPAYLFYDAEAGAKLMSAGTNMSDPKFLQAFLGQNARQLGAAGKILFPIPERGLSTRLYRIKAKTMLIWGEGDKLIPPVYAQEFQRGIADAELVVIRRAGHVAPFEQPAEVIGAIARLQ